MTLPDTLQTAVPEAGPKAGSPVILQSLLWPEQGFSSERDVYMRLHGPAYWQDDRNEIRFDTDGVAEFNTAFNLFNIGKWQRWCALEQLSLLIEGTGRFELVVFQAMPGRSWERLANRIATPKPGQPAEVDLSHHFRNPEGGIIYFTLRALDEGMLTNALWVSRQAPKRLPKLTISVTTFRREAAVRESVARFERFMADSPIAEHLHMLVVDNGQSAGLVPSAHVTPLPNENLGGAGGFSRGLLEAERRGATHCLFMDDDASIHMPAIERTWAFLAYATDDATAVAAGLLSSRHRWAIWENGAQFDRFCRPQFMGTDLRDWGQVMHMEFVTTERNPPNFYGGWWFFAFPVAHAKYRPFPFFVRGDDVSFSLANTFNIVTLPGVISSQESDFSDKETLQTVYLDLRSHLVHHLALPSMDIGLQGMLQILLFFFARSFLQCHYETIAAQNLALEDVMRGPRFFAENADMAQRRADLGKLRQNEAFKKLTGRRPQPRHRFNPHDHRTRRWLKFTLNGHLIPFFGRFGNRLVLQANQRGAAREAWGAAEITYINDAGQYFTVRHSKRAALSVGWRFLRDLVTFIRRYPALKAEWQKGYEDLASTGFWEQRLQMEPEADTAPKKD